MKIIAATTTSIMPITAIPTCSAYCSAHSTETALVKMVDDILGCMDSGSVAVVVGLDISAAFDTVCHQTLFGRLEAEFGIHGVSLEWLASSLSDRTISVRVGKSCSAAVPVHVGVSTGFRARANTVHHIHCTHWKTDRTAWNALSQIR